MTRAILLTLALACVPAVAAGQHGHGHQQGHGADRAYREQHAAGARGLSAKELEDLREGRGMGLARAAELNGYPGPRHVLDAAADGSLPLTPEQGARVQRVFDAMQGEARRVGARLIAEEEALEAAFRLGTMTESELADRTRRLAALQGELRAVHLRAHLATRAVLTDAQVQRYNEIRGYAGPAGPSPRH
ncbi:MAG TPA: hypothetical protein VEA38_02435 [Terriglobales bacterium]|nr:hypothetical protein [Terriglobales bacterium]